MIRTPNIESENVFVPLPDGPSDHWMPLDRAIDLSCARLGLPLLGGPSGKGWSHHAKAQKCPYLWKRTYIDEQDENRAVPEPLQIGALFHALLALHYGAEIPRGVVADRGFRASVKGTLRLPSDAPEKLIARLKQMAQLEKPGLSPKMSLVLEAERLFDAHSGVYGNGREDVTTLAVEWLAKHDSLNYTCRYDAICKVGRMDPQLDPGVYVFERKTAAWLSPMVREGWTLDGEILGELLCWEPSGCDKLFGPLAGVVVDVVTKEKSPKYHRFVVRRTAAVDNHARWIGVVQADIAMWKATGVFPQRFWSCYDRFGECFSFAHCQNAGKL